MANRTPTSASQRLVYQTEYSAVGRLKRQVLVAQLCGVTLLLVSPMLLGEIGHILLAIPVGIATGLYFAYVDWDRLRQSDTLSTDAERLQRCRDAILPLVLWDIAVVLGAIGLTGGVLHSHLTFVLVLIPAFLGIMRRGGKTVVGVGLLVVGIILMEWLAGRDGWADLAPSTQVARLWSYASVKSLDPGTRAGYEAVVAFSLGMGILFILVQARLSAGDTLPEHVKTAAAIRIGDDVLPEPGIRRDLAAAVDRSYNEMSRVVASTNIPELHCSEVHPLVDVVFQAYILAIPGAKMRSRTAMRRASAVTFAIHWLDDMVDCLGYHEIVRADASQKTLDLKTAQIKEFERAFRPRGVGRIMKAIRGGFLRSRHKWPEGVTAGLIRVMCGGFIQKGSKEDREKAVSRIRDEMLGYCDGALHEALKDQGPAFWWSASKTAMPLVLGIYWSPNEENALKRKSILLDVCLLPLLVHHDLREEVRRHEVPQKGFGNTTHTIIAELQQMMESIHPALIIARRELIKAAADKDPVWLHMRPVVKLSYQSLEPCLPKGHAYDNYRSEIQRLIE